jgi:tRNA-specific 2-thiouridylase
MPIKKTSDKTVAVAFSGGKDSTTAIILLREQGYEVRALTMRLGLSGEDEKLARIGNLARVLDVPWQVLDVRFEFREKVLIYAKKSDPDSWFASGHYADKVCLNGRWFFKEPVDRRKSQIYFLAMIEPVVLAKVLFPISAVTIDQVRAKVAGLPLANKEESQDVCFLQGENLAAFLLRHLPKSFREGDILDRCGNTIGRHQGAIHFTIGQRRGTRHASDRRLYVVGRDLAANTVTLGDEHDLFSGSMTVINPVFWRPLQVGEILSVKIRYQLHGHAAEIAEVSATHIRVIYKKAVRAVTPGQFGVFYDGDIIVAAGEIAGK